jgi:hypothetical protein
LRAGNEAHQELQALKQRGDSLLWLEGSGAKEQCPSLQALDAKLDAFGRCVRNSSLHCCPLPRSSGRKGCISDGLTTPSRLR